jgi:hypothetical protein
MNMQRRTALDQSTPLASVPITFARPRPLPVPVGPIVRDAPAKEPNMLRWISAHVLKPALAVAVDVVTARDDLVNGAAPQASAWHGNNMCLVGARQRAKFTPPLPDSIGGRIEQRAAPLAYPWGQRGLTLPAGGPRPQVRAATRLRAEMQRVVAGLSGPALKYRATPITGQRDFRRDEARHSSHAQGIPATGGGVAGLARTLTGAVDRFSPPCRRNVLALADKVNTTLGTSERQEGNWACHDTSCWGRRPHNYTKVVAQGAI